MSLWTNPSQERSASLISNVTSEISNYARIKISALVDPGYASREVIVFPGMEYIIKYYDTKLGVIKNLTGLVKAVYGKDEGVEPCIWFKYKENSESCTVDCKSCNRACSSKSNAKSIPICNCVLNPPRADKYTDPIVEYIPVQNLLDIRFTRENMSPTEEAKRERGTRVMILGISATTIQAIVIHLEFFDDCLEDAVKYVDLKVGNIYDVAYLSKRDDTIYEIRGKLESIQEFIDEPAKNGKGFVRETVGCDNSVITSKISKRDFMDAPPVKKIKLIFDTSEDFSGCYTTITLDSIRDCKFVSGDGAPEVDEDTAKTVCACCSHNNGTCKPSTCGHFKPNKPKPEGKYYMFGDYKVLVDGDKIMVDSKDKKFDLDMSEVLKFYLGI